MYMHICVNTQVYYKIYVEMQKIKIKNKQKKGVRSRNDRCLTQNDKGGLLHHGLQEQGSCLSFVVHLFVFGIFFYTLVPIL